MTTDMSVYMARRREARRAKLLELRNNECEKCGSIEELQFDHIDPATKKFKLSGCYLDKKWETILEELDKCQLLCVECHYKKSVKAKDFGGGHNKLDRDNFQHGTVRMYQYGPCKCDLCKLAKKLYRSKQITIDEVIPV